LNDVAADCIDGVLAPSNKCLMSFNCSAVSARRDVCGLDSSSADVGRSRGLGGLLICCYCCCLLRFEGTGRTLTARYLDIVLGVAVATIRRNVEALFVTGTASL
jgi:hypothetical protein